MPEVTTRFTRYLYLDVVDFTLNRSVEAQTDIITALNQIVRDALSIQPITPERIIFLPTGDGLAIGIIDELAAFHIHMSVALQILKLVKQHNIESADPMRQFLVRIGLSQNSDNMITDINGSKNLAGQGINSAHRIMSVADGSQIVVGQNVYDTLSYREQYMKYFRKLQASVKHDVLMPVYQFIDDSRVGLVTTVPTRFTQPAVQPKRLSLYKAYYIAYAYANKSIKMKNVSHPQGQYALTVLFHFLAEDAIDRKTTDKYSRVARRVHGEKGSSLEDAYKYYESIDFWICCKLAEFIEHLLDDCTDYFEKAFIAPNDTGIEKVRSDHPDIFGEIIQVAKV